MQVIGFKVKWILCDHHKVSVPLQKKKTDEQKESEEKVKKLKRRNADLATIARRLEDKVKQMQQDSQKVPSDLFRFLLLLELIQLNNSA